MFGRKARAGYGGRRSGCGRYGRRRHGASERVSGGGGCERVFGVVRGGGEGMLKILRSKRGIEKKKKTFAGARGGPCYVTADARSAERRYGGKSSAASVYGNYRVARRQLYGRTTRGDTSAHARRRQCFAVRTAATAARAGSPCAGRPISSRPALPSSSRRGGRRKKKKKNAVGDLDRRRARMCGVRAPSRYRSGSTNVNTASRSPQAGHLAARAESCVYAGQLSSSSSSSRPAKP